MLIILIGRSICNIVADDESSENIYLRPETVNETGTATSASAAEQRDGWAGSAHWVGGMHGKYDCRDKQRIPEMRSFHA